VISSSEFTVSYQELGFMLRTVPVKFKFEHLHVTIRLRVSYVMLMNGAQ